VPTVQIAWLLGKLKLNSSLSTPHILVMYRGGAENAKLTDDDR
jgi:hypothetical protein